MTEKATIKAVIMFFIVHWPPLPCKSCTEGKWDHGEAYNVIDSEEGLTDPLVFNDAYWPTEKKPLWSTKRDIWFFRNIKKYCFLYG